MAYSYIRFSTAHQEGGDSIRRQSKESLGALKWCQSNGYTLSDEVFIDAGKSGFKGANTKEGGELKRFIDLVDSGEIPPGCCLIIDEYSRFSRLPLIENLNLFLNVVNKGIGLAFLGSHMKKVIDTQLLNEQPYILQFIIGEITRSHSESAEKGRKVKHSAAAKLAKMRAGEILKHHNAPKYYSYNSTNKNYEQNDLAKIVKRIVDEFYAGNSLYQISRQLNADKIRSIRYHNKQANWSRMAIKSILESKCLYGEFLGIPNYFCNPVISKSLWNEIQVQLIRNKNNHGRYSTEYVNIFRGIAICSACRRPMILGCQKYNSKSGNPKKEIYRYIRCSSRSNGMPCNNNSQLNLIDLELSFFRDYLDNSPADSFDQTKTREVNKISSVIAEKEIQLSKTKTKQEALIKMAGIIQLDELVKECETTKHEIQQLSIEIDRLNIEKASYVNHSKERIPMATITDPENPDKEPEVIAYAKFTKKEIISNLKNKILRSEIRKYLPNIIGKIEINTETKTYKIFNRSSVEVFESEPVDNDRIWEKVAVASHEERHRKLIQGMSPKQITEYYEKIASEIRDQERVRNNKRRIRYFSKTNKTHPNTFEH